MGIPIKGKQLTATQAKWFRFEEEGNWLIGRFVRSEDTTWNCKRHIFVVLDSDPKVDDGNVVAVLGGKILDDIFKDRCNGDLIGLEFTGFKRSPTTRRKYKSFMVYEFTIDDLVERYGKEKVEKILNKEV